MNTVHKWRERFAARGVEGLRDADRSGRPRSYGPEVWVAIVATATSVTPHPEATWSHRAIARKVADTCFVSVSASRVGRILAGLDLKPHTVRGRLTRRDTPDFWRRAAVVCALSLDPPEGAVVLSIDEKTAIAARSRRHPGGRPAPGSQSSRSSSTGATAPPPSSPLSMSAPSPISTGSVGRGSAGKYATTSTRRSSASSTRHAGAPPPARAGRGKVCADHFVGRGFR